MANFLIDNVKTAMSAAVVDKAAGFLGIENKMIRNVIKLALPTVIGGLIRKGSSNSGAGDIMDMIGKGGFGDSAIGDLMGIFSDKGKADGFLKGGADVLPSILGNRQEGILEKLIKGSGAKKGMVTSVLSMLAPIILSKLGSVIKNKGLDAIGVSKYLGDQKSSIAGLVPGDYFEEGTSSRSTSSSTTESSSGGGGGFIKWLLPLLLIGGLAWYLTKDGCNTDTNSTTTTTEEVQTTGHEGHDHAGHDHAGHDHSGHDHAGHDHSNDGSDVRTESSSKTSGATNASYTMNANGDILGADGKVMYKADSYQINDMGDLVDGTGKVISKAGSYSEGLLANLRKKFGKLSGTKYGVNETGDLVDGSGKVLYKKGEFTEKDGYYVDKDGNRLGRVLKAIGEFLSKTAEKAGDAVAGAAAATAGAFKTLFSDMVAKKEGAKSNYSLSDIKFNEENHRITSFSKAEVEGLAQALQANPKGKIKVMASTADRAKVVRDMLVTLGVKAGQISAKKGESFDGNQVDISID